MRILLPEPGKGKLIIWRSISHDLGIPLARLRIIVELLENQADPELLGNMQKDLGVCRI
ncbi:hypothetical protein [Thiolapillus sp.]